VTRGVDDIDAVVAMLHGRDFGSDGDAALTLLITGVHDEFLAHLGLVVTEGVALFEEAINQRRLTVVDVGDDRYIENLGGVLGILGHSYLIKKALPKAERISYANYNTLESA
jgi:hypothetical protein